MYRKSILRFVEEATGRKALGRRSRKTRANIPIGRKPVGGAGQEVYKNAEWKWVQEEPKNMGAWTHLLRYDLPFDIEGDKQKV